MEITGDSCAFFFLSTGKPVAHGHQLFLRLLALGDVLIDGKGSDEGISGKNLDAVQLDVDQCAVLSAAPRGGLNDSALLNGAGKQCRFLPVVRGNQVIEVLAL